MGRPKKIKTEAKVEAANILPIKVSLKLVGQDQESYTDNVFNYLKDLQIDRLKVKSPARFTFYFNGKEFMKTLTLPQTRRFIGNNMYKMIVAKWVNQNLGIVVDNYN